MNPLSEIIDWLNSKRKFSTGLVLYEKYGTNRKLLRRFNRSGSTAFNKGLLFEQLKQIALTLELSRKSKKKSTKNKTQPSPLATPEQIKLKQRIVISASGLPKAHATSVDDLSNVDFSLLPPELKYLSTKKGDLYREASRLHREMLSCDDKETRADKARVIVENMRENELIYSEIRHFLNNGKFLKEHPYFHMKDEKAGYSLETIPADLLIRKIHSRSAQLSRVRKWLRENKAKPNYKIRLSEATSIELEIKQMRERLNVIQTK